MFLTDGCGPIIKFTKMPVDIIIPLIGHRFLTFSMYVPRQRETSSSGVDPKWYKGTPGIRVSQRMSSNYTELLNEFLEVTIAKVVFNFKSSLKKFSSPNF